MSDSTKPAADPAPPATAKPAAKPAAEAGTLTIVALVSVSAVHGEMTAPGGNLTLPTDEAEALIARGFARIAIASEPPPADGG